MKNAPVQVCEGELINLQGTSVGINGDLKFKGETGAVVAIDGTKDAMSIRTPDLQICKETATCVDSSGQFHQRDLVNVSSNKVGVVVRIEKEYLQLLNTNGKVEKVSIRSIKRNESEYNNN
ncbi:unnamed protein product [Rotaria socialis]|uniref:Spt5 KOWx domain-containing protein n=1 Tax=Rotaria socialis TaxID=392032 RepID=A0A820WA15_9BILA|nr:unnamed protein product [Rotaria socialis]